MLVHMKKVWVVLLVAFLVACFAFAEEQPLRALGHAVHQKAAAGLEPFPVEWRTYGLADIRELLFREATLPEPPYDLGFLLNFWASPIITNYFEPLNEWLALFPIPGFPEDFPPGMIETLTFDGKIYGIPMRTVVVTLHYNKAIFEERGVEVPTTIEELFEAAKKLSFVREDGTRVYGLVFEGLPTLIGDPLIALARAWGDAGVVTPDYRVVCDEAPMVTVLTKIRELFEIGALPPDILSYEVTDKIRMMQAGQAAMTLAPADYYARFNDPQLSSVAGNVEVAMIPPAAECKDLLPGSRSLLNFWSFVIPRNSSIHSKQRAWEFIQHLSTPEAQLYSALNNGNMPTRLSVWESDEFASKIPYAKVAAQVLKIAQVPWPGFDNITKAQDIFGTEAHLAIMGLKSPQEAMYSAAEQIRSLLAAEGLLREP